jgi:histidine ammonia-lyase
MLDSLVCALNEMGHMSFLRAERILNKHLTSNRLAANKEHYELLMISLKKVSTLVAQNKLLAVPTNAETVIMDNYQHDIFVDEGSPICKLTRMLANLREIMKVEVFAATDVLHDFYGSLPRIFASEEMEGVYREFHKVHSRGDFREIAARVEKWLNDG